MKYVRFDDNDDLFDIRQDSVFKAVFTRNTPESREGLADLLSAIIGRELSVINLTANEPPVDDLRDRQIRFDINCKTLNGEPINVEMSFNPNVFEPVRLEYYSGKLFTGQDIKGTKKTFDDLKMSYQVGILAKKTFFDDTEFYHSFEYYDSERQVALGGRSRIITLELAKTANLTQKPTTAMSPKELWAAYFRYLTDKKKREKINEIVRSRKGIMMASKVLMRVTKDERERAY